MYCCAEKLSFFARLKWNTLWLPQNCKKLHTFYRYIFTASYRNCLIGKNKHLEVLMLFLICRNTKRNALKQDDEKNVSCSMLASCIQCFKPMMWREGGRFNLNRMWRLCGDVTSTRMPNKRVPDVLLFLACRANAWRPMTAAWTPATSSSLHYCFVCAGCSLAAVSKCSMALRKSTHNLCRFSDQLRSIPCCLELFGNRKFFLVGNKSNSDG